MITAWILNAISIFVTTAGALLMFLALRELPRFAENAGSSEGRSAFKKQQRLLTVGAGLLGAWLVLQCLAIIL